VEHLSCCLNIVCGRFARAGDPVNPSVFSPARSPRAQAVSPSRRWEAEEYRNRFGHSLLCSSGGKYAWRQELPTVTLLDEILEQAPDRVRALVVIGGNPAVSIPDQLKTVRALQQLELLVTIDPFPTETVRLSHYVLAPSMWVEHADHTGPWETMMQGPFAQYTDAVLAPPAPVRDDWEYLAGIGLAMGLDLQVGGRTYYPGDPLPSTPVLLEQLAGESRVALSEIRRHPHGRMYEELEHTFVLPPEDTSGRFCLLPDDVADELAAALADPAELDARPYLFTSRRVKESMNSTGRRIRTIATVPYNKCFMHPDDLGELGLTDGAVVRIESDAGSIRAVAAPDAKLKRRVVSMTHGWGDLPGEDDDPHRYGSSAARLVSGSGAQAIAGMPRMTAIPVSIEAVEPA
jgi:anaerobic selenocysteine-containing dehydrogenase